MKCEKCPFAPVSYEDECGWFEKYGYEDNKGNLGCKVHYQTLAKNERRYNEYLDIMGTEMSLQMIWEQNGWKMEQTINDCKHMIGFSYAKRYHRHGKSFCKIYRNGWSEGSSNKKDFDELVNCGYMNLKINDYGSYVYHLTKQGLKWLSRRLEMEIKEDKNER